MNYRIVRNIERPDPTLLEKIRAFNPTCVSFTGPLNLGNDLALDPAIKPLRFGASIFGPAFTVKVDVVDHLMPMYATYLAQPGDVLVIAAGGRTDVGIWGGSMTRSAGIRRLAGVVIDGVVCDSAGLINPDNPRNLPPIFARGGSPTYSTWDQPGSINVPVYCGGRLIEPGDLIVGNQDGVIAVPKTRLAEALNAVEYFHSQIPIWHGGLDQGKTWFEVLGLQEQIDRLAIPEFDR